MISAMPTLNASAARGPGQQDVHSNSVPLLESSAVSAVSWAAIFAGAAAAAALSLILLMLGAGLGLSVASPWAQNGIRASAFGLSAIVWLTVTKLFASGLGGYLAGRLRTRWLAVHADEVYFRDTAHGFLAWAVATLTTAALLTSLFSSVVSGGVQAGVTAAGAATVAGGALGDSEVALPDVDSMLTGYAMDSLFRSPPNAAQGSPSLDAAGAAPGVTHQGQAQQLAEVTRIFMNTLRTGALPAEDLRYVGQIVAQRTGLSQQDAEKRVTETYGRMQDRLIQAQTAAREAVDKARKASTYAALWLFISLLAGAFTASLLAIYGGRQRDL